MQADQVEMRAALEQLADHEGGRRLLQLALRSIESGDHELVSGCWTRKGDAGCLFQHAYWQGVRDGVFADSGRPGDWIGNFVGSKDYGIVIRVIESFDRLAKSTYSDIEPRTLLPDRARLRQQDWNGAVEQMLLDVLGDDDGGELRQRTPEPAIA
jgi:hypothetical protein